jgi:predicted transcriptional regulator
MSVPATDDNERYLLLTVEPDSIGLYGELTQMIMNYIWSLPPGTPIKIKDVQRHLERSGAERAYTTIMTTMQRLAVRGVLRVQSSGRAQPDLYFVELTRQDLVRRVITALRTQFPIETRRVLANG